MFANLRTALHQKGITEKQYAEFLGVEERSVQSKLKGATDLHIWNFRKLVPFFSQSTKPTICLKRAARRKFVRHDASHNG